MLWYRPVFVRVNLMPRPGHHQTQGTELLDLGSLLPWDGSPTPATCYRAQGQGLAPQGGCPEGKAAPSPRCQLGRDKAEGSKAKTHSRRGGAPHPRAPPQVAKPMAGNFLWRVRGGVGLQPTPLWGSLGPRGRGPVPEALGVPQPPEPGRDPWEGRGALGWTGLWS